MFQVLFGDDEHTAAEGPYFRMLRARKWLLLTAGLATLHGYHLIDLGALKKALGGIATIPPWMLTSALIAGLAYLIVQYGLLAGQLWVTYKASVYLRIPEDQEMKRLRERLAELRKQERGVNENVETGQLRPPEYNILATEILDEISAIRRTFDVRAALHLSNNRTFMASEYCVDAMRLIPPLLVALYAVGHLLMIKPGF